jgi:hypothetical protein
MANKPKTDTASAEFKKAQRDQDARKAMSEYEAEGAAMRAKTERLRALRLARDAAAPKPEPAKAKAVKKPKASSASLSEWLDGERKDGKRG